MSKKIKVVNLTEIEHKIPDLYKESDKTIYKNRVKKPITKETIEFIAKFLMKLLLQYTISSTLKIYRMVSNDEIRIQIHILSSKRNYEKREFESYLELLSEHYLLKINISENNISAHKIFSADIFRVIGTDPYIQFSPVIRGLNLKNILQDIASRSFEDEFAEKCFELGIPYNFNNFLEGIDGS